MNNREYPAVFVIGTASLDVLHLPDGRTVNTAGGAGLYTALAAHKTGVSAGLLAPRPSPMPQPLQAVANRLDWVGPKISPDGLPRLEIEHHGGGKATLKDASWGAEPQLLPDAITADIARSKIIHIAALSTAQRQLDFLHKLKTGGRQSLLSAGTYAQLVYNDTDRVRQLLALADIFFMNENEAKGLFGRADKARTQPGALLFVTLGAAGALVIEGKRVTHIAVQPAPEIDPTGAGDTFCGATLAELSRGQSPVIAAQRAVILAAKTIGAVGPVALLGID
jgi:ribokinase